MKDNSNFRVRNFNADGSVQIWDFDCLSHPSIYGKVMKFIVDKNFEAYHREQDDYIEDQEEDDCE